MTYKNGLDEIILPQIGLRLYREKLFIKASDNSYERVPEKIYYVVLELARAYEGYLGDPETYPTPVVTENELAKRLDKIADSKHPGARLFSASKFCVSDLIKSKHAKKIFRGLVVKEPTIRGTGPAFRLRVSATRMFADAKPLGC
jgi:hypothetical protein